MEGNYLWVGESRLHSVTEFKLVFWDCQLCFVDRCTMAGRDKATNQLVDYKNKVSEVSHLKRKNINVKKLIFNEENEEVKQVHLDSVYRILFLTETSLTVNTF